MSQWGHMPEREEIGRQAAAEALRKFAETLVEGLGYDEDCEVCDLLHLTADAYWPGTVEQ